MGREIRRVPLGWDPPLRTDRRGATGFQPMHDETYDHAAREWLANCAAWEAGTHPDRRKYGGECRYYWEWQMPPEDPAYYRPEWPADAVLGYRVYETVSEGTPIGPAFATLEELRLWLLTQGYSETAAQQFVDRGWAPSMVLSNVGGQVTMHQNIAALDELFTAPKGEEAK